MDPIQVVNDQTKTTVTLSQFALPDNTPFWDVETRAFPEPGLEQTEYQVTHEVLSTYPESVQFFAEQSWYTDCATAKDLSNLFHDFEFQEPAPEDPYGAPYAIQIPVDNGQATD